jgi:excisionase family DNA binding protein
MSVTSVRTVEPGDLLTVSEVAERLKIARNSVYRKVYQGELEAVPIGVGRRPHIRIRAESLNALVGGVGGGSG